jgi:hypothetical protein
MTILGILAAFPGLVDSRHFKVTSPRTPTYNCIAYAAGDFRRWWWPDPLGVFFWPQGAPRLCTLMAFQKAFELVGYNLTGDRSLEAGYERIAIFAQEATPTHAARQLPNGLWASKLGRLEDISHELDGVEGGDYGRVVFFMRRKLR